MTIEGEIRLNFLLVRREYFCSRLLFIEDFKDIDYFGSGDLICNKYMCTVDCLRVGVNFICV